jgi:ABC-2 type transport system permease protein
MDLKLKYHRGFFGFFWSFFKPLSQFFAYYLVFGIILKIGKVSYYPLELFLGVLTWSWFTESTSQGVVCFINKKSIITQIATNRLYPPFAAFLAPTMNYFLNLIVFFCAYLCWGDSGLFIETHYSVLHALFVFLLAVSIISLIILSLNILLAYTNARYRDIQSFWELILMYGMFVTPIFYMLPIPQNYQALYFAANPLALPILMLKSVFFPIVLPTLGMKFYFCYVGILFSLVGLSYMCHIKSYRKITDFI